MSDSTADKIREAHEKGLLDIYAVIKAVHALEQENASQKDIIDVIEKNRQNHLEWRIEAEKERDELKARVRELENVISDLDTVTASRLGIPTGEDKG